MRKSIDPMQELGKTGSNWHYRRSRCSSASMSFQSAIPWQVALRQSLPPLHRPETILHNQRCRTIIFRRVCSVSSVTFLNEATRGERIVDSGHRCQLSPLLSEAPATLPASPALRLLPQRSPKSGSSAHLVKGEDERVRGGTSSVSRAMRKYCGIRVSWVAEVIFRFAYEPVAVDVARGSPGGAADCRSRPHHLSCARVSSGGSLSGVYPPF